MTLSEWIENYCEENELELPDGIPNEKVALDFIIANKAGGVQPEGTINITENGNDITSFVKTSPDPDGSGNNKSTVKILEECTIQV